MDQLCGLLAGPAEDQGALAGVQGLGDFFQGEEPGGVEGGHVAQAQDDHRRQLVQVLGDDGKFVGGAEQERSMDAEDGGIVRDVFVLENVHASVFDVVVGDLRDGGGRGDAADEEQRGQNHSGFDGYRVRSAKTVRAKVTSQMLMSVFVSFSNCGISRHSPML